MLVRAPGKIGIRESEADFSSAPATASGRPSRPSEDRLPTRLAWPGTAVMVRSRHDPMVSRSISLGLAIFFIVVLVFVLLRCANKKGGQTAGGYKGTTSPALRCRSWQKALPFYHGNVHRGHFADLISLRQPEPFRGFLKRQDPAVRGLPATGVSTSRIRPALTDARGTAEYNRVLGELPAQSVRGGRDRSKRRRHRRSIRALARDAGRSRLK